jgi:hypothetical protein
MLNTPSDRTWKIIVLPLWLLPILTAILPVRWWLIRRRRGGREFPVEAKPAEGGAG